MTTYKPDRLIPLLTPNIGPVESSYVKRCLDSNWVAYTSSMVTEFEERVSDFTGAKYCIATNTGTAALHLSLLCIDVKTDDFVITSPLSFVSPVNVIKYVGADPIFIDVKETNWQMDPDILERFLIDECVVTEQVCYHRVTGRRISCLLLVHTLGFCGDLIRIVRIAKSFFIKVVEDAACAVGSFYENRHLGTFGDIGCLSFNGNKVITTSGGGAILTEDNSIARKAYHLSTQAKSSSDYNHDAVGFNYRMTGLSAALGLGQLERINELLEQKKNTYGHYLKAFSKIVGIGVPEFHKHSSPNCWLFAAYMPKAPSLLKYLLDMNIEARTLWKPLPELSIFHSSIFISNKNVVSKIFESSLSLPSSTLLRAADQEYIIDKITEYYLTVK